MGRTEWDGAGWGGVDVDGNVGGDGDGAGLRKLGLMLAGVGWPGVELAGLGWIRLGLGWGGAGWHVGLHIYLGGSFFGEVVQQQCSGR